ncbi:MAG: hypothetical protein ABIS07_17115 [Dokdonella sp.]
MSRKFGEKTLAPQGFGISKAFANLTVLISVMKSLRQHIDAVENIDILTGNSSWDDVTDIPSARPQGRMAHPAMSWTV